MRKIVLHNLSPDIQELISDRANAEKLTHIEAVIEILHDAAIARAVQHDMEIIEALFEKDTEDDVLDVGPLCRASCCPAQAGLRHVRSVP